MSFAFAKDTVRKGLDAHSAIGLVCCALLYLICATGTAVVLYEGPPACVNTHQRGQCGLFVDDLLEWHAHPERLGCVSRAVLSRGVHLQRLEPSRRFVQAHARYVWQLIGPEGRFIDEVESVLACTVDLDRILEFEHEISGVHNQLRVRLQRRKLRSGVPIDDLRDPRESRRIVVDCSVVVKQSHRRRGVR